MCLSDARSEEQICHCVCQGERPSEELVPKDTPPEIIDLMETSWHKDPHSRPTFFGVFIAVKALKCFLNDFVIPFDGKWILPAKKFVHDMRVIRGMSSCFCILVKNTTAQLYKF